MNDRKKLHLWILDIWIVINNTNHERRKKEEFKAKEILGQNVWKEKLCFSFLWIMKK